MAIQMWTMTSDGVPGSNAEFLTRRDNDHSIFVLESMAPWLDLEVSREAAENDLFTRASEERRQRWGVPADPAIERVAGGGVWSDVLRVIEVHVNRHTLETWFRPLELVEDRGDVMVIACPEFFADWIERNHGDLVRQAVETVRSGARIEFVQQSQRKSGLG